MANGIPYRSAPPLVDPRFGVRAPALGGGLLSGAAKLPGILERPSLLQRIGGGLGQFFGGPDDPNLSAAQNEQARKQAMLMAGLQMMANSGYSTTPRTLGEIVASGAMAGMQAGDAYRGQALEQSAVQKAARQREEMEATVRAGGPRLEMLHRLFTQAVQSGDSEMATRIATVIQAVEASERERVAPVDNAPYMIRGEGINPATGKPEMFLQDRRTGEVKWSGVQPVPPAASSTNSDLQNQRAFTRENSLRDDYRMETREIADAYNMIESVLQQGAAAEAGDPTAQVGMLYGFIRALDPGSVVREGEIALARAAAPIWQRAQTFAAEIAQGKSPAIPVDMVRQMRRFMAEMQAEKERYWGEIHENYTESAARWGVSPDVFRAPPRRYGRPADPAAGAGRFRDLIPPG